VAYFMAEALRGLKEYNTAIDEYNKILSPASENCAVFAGASYIGRGICYAEISEYDKASEDFVYVMEKYKYDDTLTMKGRFELARVKELLGLKEEARRLYMLVAILYNNDYYGPEALFRAGIISEALGRGHEALAAFKEIIEKYKESHVYEKAIKKIKIVQ